MRLDRHRIVHLDPTAWRGLVKADSVLAAIPSIEDWVERGRPLIARRPACSDGPGLTPLGLPLPAALAKRRLAFATPPDAIVSTSEPPLLSDAAVAAPPHWHAALAELLTIDPETRCFGSLAWEYMTGLPYLSAASDLDVLWRASTSEDADRRVAAVARIEINSPMRIDGEIVAPGGLAVQWREWASDARILLGKGRDGSRLVARAALFG